MIVEVGVTVGVDVGAGSTWNEALAARGVPPMSYRRNSQAPVALGVNVHEPAATGDPDVPEQLT